MTLCRAYNEWAVRVPNAIQYGPYDERESAMMTQAALTVPSDLLQRTVRVTRSEWQVVLEDGCIGGHSPSLVSCALGSDWP